MAVLCEQFARCRRPPPSSDSAAHLVLGEASTDPSTNFTAIWVAEPKRCRTAGRVSTVGSRLPERQPRRTISRALNDAAADDPSELRQLLLADDEEQVTLAYSKIRTRYPDISDPWKQPDVASGPLTIALLTSGMALVDELKRPHRLLDQRAPPRWPTGWPTLFAHYSTPIPSSTSSQHWPHAPVSIDAPT
jgi:hypothetical protein